MGIKVAIIGTGGVGAAIAFGLNFLEEVNDIAMIDLNEEHMMGEVLDISHGLKELSKTQTRAGAYQDCKDSQVIIITAGINRKVGQSREDLLEVNKAILDDVINNIKPYYDDSFIIIVSNPVDRLTAHVINMGIVPPHKICGTGCMLDTSRCISELSRYISVPTTDIEAFSVGTHGSNQQIIWDDVTVKGENIEDYCYNNGIMWNSAVKERIHQNVTMMGADIIAKKGRTQYGIAMTTVHLVKALIGEVDTIVSVGTAYCLENGKANSSLVNISNLMVKPL